MGRPRASQDRRYAVDEVERRWLAIDERLPDLTALDAWILEDLYVEGSRLRLRKMIHRATGETRYKLCKKYGKTGPITEPITNIHLDRAEYALFRDLPGRRIVRRRYLLTYEGVGFSINVPEAGDVVIVEAEYASVDAAARSPVPPFCGREVSSDPAFEAVALGGAAGGGRSPEPTG